MPRKARRDAPDEIHHVFVRGLEKRDIFVDEEDRRDLVSRLSRVLPESDVRCLAWALLPNHFHLVLKRGRVPLARPMARINGGYATRFNLRHDRSGFLFQNRFGSRIVETDADLTAVVQYVTFNPLKHGLCSDESELGRYASGSFSALRGHRVAHPFEAIPLTRSILDGTPNLQAPSPRASRAEPDKTFQLAEWVVRVCDLRGIDRDALLGGRQGAAFVEARAMLCWIAVSLGGLSGAETGRRLGMTKSAVSRAIDRGRILCERQGIPRRCNDSTPVP